MSYFKGIGRKSGSYTGRKLPLIGLLENKKHTIFNEYTVGSGVGASSVATRRLKKQRARIKKCTPLEPIYPELDENEYFEVSDDITNFNEIKDKVENMELERNFDLKDNTNKVVDADVFATYATSHIEEVSKTNEVSSLTFTTISVANPADVAVNVYEVSNVNQLLSSNNYEVRTSVNYVSTEPGEEEEESISQNIEHTFINTGKQQDEKLIIEYIMTITVFESLQ